MDNVPSTDLLESSHSFPGVYQIKAIGRDSEGFEAKVVEAVVAELTSTAELDYSVRGTPGGRHIAVTLDIKVQTAEQVRLIYTRIQAIDGLLLLL